MLTKGTSSKSIYLVVVIALLVRIVAAIVWQVQLGEDTQFKFGDSDGYWQLGQKIAEGEPYQYNSEHAKVFRTPGYPIFLGAIFSIWNDPPVVVVRLFGALLGALSVWLVWHLALILFDRRTAWYASWIACFYPGAIAMSILVLAESLYVPLMLFQFLATALAFKSHKKVAFIVLSIVAGFFFGVACLTRPSWLLIVPFAFLMGQVFYSRRLRQAVFASICMTMLCVVMFPWWVRNYDVTGKFVLTSLQTGTSLYDGLNPDATGASDMNFAPKMKAEYLREYRKNQIGPEREFEFAFNELMKQRAIDWARSNPIRVAQLAWIKFTRIWTPLPNSAEIGSAPIRYGIAAFFIPLIVFALWGAFRFRRDFVAVIVCVGPVVYYTLLHMVFVGSIRYRQPPMMTMLILAAAIIAALGSRRKRP